MFFIFDVSFYELFYDSLMFAYVLMYLRYLTSSKSSSRQDNAFDLKDFIC